MLEELPSCLSFNCYKELSDDEFRRSVNSYKEIELTFSRLHLGNVDVEGPDGVALELLALGDVALDILKTGDAVPLQRKPGLMRDRRLQAIKTVVQRKKRVAPERDDCHFLGFDQNRRARCRRPCLYILERRALPPLRHRLRVNAEFLAQLRERSLRWLYCSFDSVRGCGAPVTNLSHSAALHTREGIAPSNHGINQLALSEQVFLRHFVVRYRAGDGSIIRYV